MEQLARLYARGRIFGFTQKNLTPDQALDRDYFAKLIYDDTEIQAHKKRFTQKLASIIGSDYKDIEGAGVQDAYLAIHKAVLSHTYHTPLEVRCTNIDDINLNGNQIQRSCIVKDNDVIEIGEEISILIEEKLPIPPEHTITVCTKSNTFKFTTNPRGISCNPNYSTKFNIIRDDVIISTGLTPEEGSNRLEFSGQFDNVRVNDIVEIIEGPGLGSKAIVENIRDNTLHLSKPRALLIGSDRRAMRKEYEKLYNKHSVVHGSPQYLVIPTLRPVHVIIKSRVPNLRAMFDEVQRRKIGKQFIWGYFSQHIRENKRAVNKIVRPIKQEAHIVAMYEMESLLSSTTISFEIQDNSPSILVDTNIVPMEVAQKIASIKREYIDYGVEIISIEGYGYDIRTLRDTVPIISKQIKVFHYISGISRDTEFDDEGNISDILQSEAAHVDSFGDFDAMLSKDIMNTLRKKIPAIARTILDIWTNTNEEYNKIYDGKIAKKYIMKFLDIKGNEYDKLKFVIGHHLATLVRLDDD